MTRQELRLERVEHGEEMPSILIALDRVEVDDLVVYHRGPSGSASTSMKRAARELQEIGLCRLVQRITEERDKDGNRIVDYIAVKAKKGRR